MWYYKRMKDLGLYIHIPFCESKCYYCNFVSFCKSGEEKERYVNCLVNEIKSCKSKFKDYIVSTIFVGGGTPSCLSDGLLSKIFNELYDNFNISENCEISIEANPNSITKEFVHEIKKCGVNRVSIGLQTSNDNLLKMINRIHTKQDYINAIKLLQQEGFCNINTDLLIGLPNQTKQDIKDSLDLLIENKINHISCYGLILEENTKMYKLIESKVLSLPSEDECNSQYDFVLKYLKENNYNRYEVSNFSKKGYECRHNLKYWQGDEYLGLGLVSSSYINKKRFANTEIFKDYCEYYKMSKTRNIDDLINNKIVENCEDVSEKDYIEERIMLEIRTSNGIDLIKLKQDVNYDLLNNKYEQINKLKQLNLIKLENNHIIATDEGFYVLNQIILDLID